jgi:hypothetical protein
VPGNPRQPHCVLLCAIVRSCAERRVTHPIALTRAELAYLEAAAACEGLSLEAFLEELLRAYVAVLSRLKGQ